MLVHLNIGYRKGIDRYEIAWIINEEN